jgi:hypothetical protein
MTVTKFLIELARKHDLAGNKQTATRIRTAACSTMQWEENDRIARRERAKASANAVVAKRRTAAV